MGTASIPKIIFSIGTAVNIACVLTKIQSSQNFSKADTPVPFHIPAIDMRLDFCTFSV